MKINDIFLALTLLAHAGPVLSAVDTTSGTVGDNPVWLDATCRPKENTPSCGENNSITRRECQRLCSCTTTAKVDSVRCTAWGTCKGEDLVERCKCTGLAGSGTCGASLGVGLGRRG